ncbi:hypothetical protein [Roseovarius sp. M141]|uniref:hypothetical protein n=1 Tax=Roseovarius sp. M141 TaxID=2583806 RepID=UPI0034E94ADF
MTEITPYDVEKLLNKVAVGRARPSKAKPNNRARKLQGAKADPSARQPDRRGAAQDVHLCCRLGLARGQSGLGFRRRIENPRERFLSHEEIRKLAEALGDG